MTKARQREVFWMVCALIHARNSPATFAALTALVRAWSENQLCLLAEKLVPTPDLPRDHRSAIALIEQFSAGRPKHVCQKLRHVSEEIARTTDIYHA